MRTLFSVVASALLVSSTVFAQTVTLSGVIVDPSGAVLPGVQVQLAATNQGQQITRTVRTDAAGRYTLTDLAPGSYAMTTRLPGFADTAQVVKLTDANAVQDLTLGLGMLQETIHITASDTPPPSPLAVRSSPPPTVPASAPPPPPATRAGAIRVGGNIKVPTKIANVMPIYPATLAAEKVGGVVILQGTIGPDGVVRDVMALRSPHDDLTRAAFDAFMQWRFTPTLLNGSPVDVRMTGTFYFDAN